MYFLGTVRLNGETRCVGYFETKEQAEYILYNNVADIYEKGYYPLAIIEHIPAGLYQYDDKPSWYQWVNDKYEMCSTPRFAKDVIGFCIG